MTHHTPSSNSRNLRTFIASLLAYVLLTSQLAPMVMAFNGSVDLRAPGRTPDIERKKTSEAPPQGRVAGSFAPVPVPLRVTAAGGGPIITATKVDSFDDSDSDGKAEPGEVITYSINITNTGTDPALNLTLTDTVDPNTTIVPGSVHSTPLAFADTYGVLGNVRISVPDGPSDLLANDVDPENVGNTNAGLTVTTLAGDTSAPFAGTSTNGGNVTATTGDGSFQYNPPPGFTGTDTFTYTATDSTGGGTSTATVTLTISGLIWFVNSAAAVGGDGRLTNPFNCYTGTSSGVQTCFSDTAVDDPGDVIFLFSGAYIGGNTLLNNQRLVGQGATDTLANIGGVTVPTFSDLLPTTGGASPTIITTVAATNAVNLGQGNHLRGFTVGNTTGAKIFGNNFGTLTAGNNAAPDLILNGSGQALNLTNGTFAATSGFSSVTTTSSTGQGIFMSQIAGTVSFGSTTVSGSTTQGILFQQSTATVNFGNTSVTSSAGTGVSLVGNGGAITFADLDISPDSGQRAFHATSNTGAITTTSGTVSTTSQIAFEIVGVSIASRTPLNMQLTTINANGGTSGIILTNTSATGSPGGFVITGSGGTCSTVPASCTGGTIQNSTQDAVRLTSANSISLTDMSLTTSGQSHVEATTVIGLTLVRINADLSTEAGILGSSLTNLTITNGTYDRGGAGSVPCNVNGVEITNLLGTSSVTGATFKRSNTIQFHVNNNTATNFAGTADQLTVSGTNWNTHTNPCAGDHLSVNSDTGGNFKLIVNSTSGINTVVGAGIGVQATSGGTNGKMESSVTGLNTSGNTAGVVIGNTGTGSTNKFNIFGNKTANGTGFSGTGSLAIAITHVSSAGTTSGVINDNTVTHTAGPGTNAVQLVLEGGGTLTSTVSNNTISGNYQRGIQGQSRLGTGLLSLTINNNTLTGTDITGTALQQINLETGGSGTGHGNDICLNMHNNSVNLGPGATYTAAYRLTNRGAANCTLAGGCSFFLQDFVGNGSSTADVMTWVTTTKSNTGTPVSVTATAPFAASAGNCSTPSAPEIFIDEIPGPGGEPGEKGTPGAPVQQAAATTSDSITARPFISSPRQQTAQATTTAARPVVAPRAAVDSRREQTTPPKPADMHTPQEPVISGDTITWNIGTLPAGASITITFQVTVDNPFNGALPQVSNQGTVTADGGISVLTDDPSEPGANDPTVTLIAVPPDVFIRDARVAEPTSGTTSMLFTVALSAPATQLTTINYSTADGSAVAPGDYIAVASSTITFMIGEQLKTIPITVNSDVDNTEVDENFTVSITADPAVATVVDGTATGTITVANPAGTVLISELRTSGPGGGTDDFVEIYNNTNTPHTVTASDASLGYGVFKIGGDCNTTPVLLGTIPNGTVIPARGHYLLVGTGYSLGAYATGNLTMSSDIENDRNVALFSTTDVMNLATVTRFDAVGFGTNTGNLCDLQREGTNLGAVAGSTLEYSFFRKECDFVAGTGCTTPGTPKDTNDNAADFLFADTAATPVAGAGQRLGAPGPENLASPIKRDPTIALVLLDGSVAAAAPPNRVRDFTSDPPNNSTFGTMSVRRRIINNTGGSVTRLRFRIVEITTAPPPGGVADLRARTSVTVMGVGVNDSATCAATGTPATAPCTVTVNGLTLEQPPNQPNGGGFNSTLAAGTITTGTPLANGASVNVQFLLGIQQTGLFRFLVIIEALP